MGKLEAVVLIVVLLVAAGGLYYFFASTGKATRTLLGCEGDFTAQLRLGGAKESTDYRFKGIHGTVRLLDIEDGKAKFLIDGTEETPYLGFQEIFLGSQCGIKMSKISRTTAMFCLASTVPECVAHIWDPQVGTRVCVEYRSSADYKFESGGHSRAWD